MSAQPQLQRPPRLGPSGRTGGPLKIAVVVHGRFHAFDLARELLARGHDVTLLTNYPGWAAEPFGISRRRVRSFTLHGVLVRALGRLSAASRRRAPDALPHALFGRWAARELARERWDIIHPFSGIAEELLREPRLAGTPKLLMRGSAHIRTQDRLLAEEERRTGAALERPSHWMIAREQREYALADQIVVLSSFARDSFRAEGVAAAKLAVLPLGVDTGAFRPDSKVVEERCRRILAGEPLRVLYVGALSFQKGMWDLATLAAQLDSAQFSIGLVGAVSPEIGALEPTLRRHATLTPALPQRELPQHYAQGDIFCFPTIQDGFAMVLTQAQAGGLPIIATTNCAGPDLIREGETGWVVPIRSPEAFAQRLSWCADHREELATMVRRVYDSFRPRDWAAVAADFERICGMPQAA